MPVTGQRVRAPPHANDAVAAVLGDQAVGHHRQLAVDVEGDRKSTLDRPEAVQDVVDGVTKEKVGAFGR